MAVTSALLQKIHKVLKVEVAQKQRNSCRLAAARGDAADARRIRLIRCAEHVAPFHHLRSALTGCPTRSSEMAEGLGHIGRTGGVLVDGDGVDRASLTDGVSAAPERNPQRTSVPVAGISIVRSPSIQASGVSTISWVTPTLSASARLVVAFSWEARLICAVSMHSTAMEATRWFISSRMQIPAASPGTKPSLSSQPAAP